MRLTRRARQLQSNLIWAIQLVGSVGEFHRNVSLPRAGNHVKLGRSTWNSISITSAVQHSSRTAEYTRLNKIKQSCKESLITGYSWDLTDERKKAKWYEIKQEDRRNLVGLKYRMYYIKFAYHLERLPQLHPCWCHTPSPSSSSSSNCGPYVLPCYQDQWILLHSVSHNMCTTPVAA